MLRDTALAVCALVYVCSSQAVAAAGTSLGSLVDTRIGTGGLAFGVGSTNPGPQWPFGAMRLGPDTAVGPDLGAFGGYYYDDPIGIKAFSHTHMVGSGAGDYGNFGVMVQRSAITDDLITSYGGALNHSLEVAEPGFYSIEFLKLQAAAETTVSGPWAGIHRYNCSTQASAGSEPCTLLLDACHTTARNQDGACKAGNISTFSPVSSSEARVLEASSSILLSGSLSGRSPIGGVWVHGYFRLEVQGGGSIEGSVWSNGSARAAPVSGPQVVEEVTGNSLGAGVSVQPAVAGREHAAATSQGGVLRAGRGDTASGRDRGTPLAAGVQFTLRVGISFISVAGAKRNLEAEQALSTGDGEGEGEAAAGATASWLSFEAARAAAADAWEERLQRVRVQPTAGGGIRARTASGTVEQSSDELQRVLYAALYRAHMAPTIFSEHDGRYMSMGGSVEQWEGPPSCIEGVKSWYRTDMSLWDIHRTQTALLSLLAPSDSLDVSSSLLQMREDGGRLPRWPLANVYTGCMVGSHAIQVLSDAAGKGLLAQQQVLRACSVAAEAADSQAAEGGAQSYQALGYIPSERNQRGAAVTLDYSYDDAAAGWICALANDTANSSRLQRRSGNYRNVFAYSMLLDEGQPFPCPRSQNGSFDCPLDPTLQYPLETHYVEGDAWNYRWFVLHDMEGLVDLFVPPGSNETHEERARAFVEQLDTYMNRTQDWPLGNALPNPYYWGGNEPVLANAWQFAQASPLNASLTQAWSRYFAIQLYNTEASGVPGNDDYGTMSAWLVWTHLGLFPVAGTDRFVLGAPAFANASLVLPAEEAALALGALVRERLGNSERGSGEGPTPSMGDAMRAVRGYAECLTGSDRGELEVLRIVAKGASIDAPFVRSASINGQPLHTPGVTNAQLLGGAADAVAAFQRSGACDVAAEPPVLAMAMASEPAAWSAQ